MCLFFLALGKLGAIPGDQGGRCRLPYQLGQAAAEAALAWLQSLPPALGSLCQRDTFSLPFFPTRIFLLP